MKKILFLFVGIIISNNLFSQVQFTKDTVYLEGKPVGILSDVITEEKTVYQGPKEVTGSGVTYTITLSTPLTYDEKIIVKSQYNPKLSPFIEVRFLENFVFSSNQAKAGFLLEQAGELKTQRNNLYLASALVTCVGSIIQISNTQSSQFSISDRNNIAYATISLGTVLTISAIVKDYKANLKLKEAGITLQK